MSRKAYTKPAKTYIEQLQLLKSRGLKINSEAKALHLLEKLSYYRLSGYWYPLLKDPKNWEKEPLWKFKPTLKQRIRILLAYSIR